MLVVCEPTGILLLMSLSPCSDDDVEEFRANPVTFGLLPMKGGYCWLLRTALCTFDAPYCPGLEAPDRRALCWDIANMTERTRGLLQVDLVDNTGIVRAIRATTVSPDFTRAVIELHKAALVDERPTPTSWDIEIAGMYRRFPDPERALRAAAFTSVGGD